MPFAPAALNDYVQALVVDQNFATLQDLFRSGLLQIDRVGQFHRWKWQRRSVGRLASVSVLNVPYLELENDAVSRYRFDLTYRHGTESPNPVAGPDFTSLANDGPWATYAMEMLGRPGPSFVQEWQELGLAQPTGAVGWPPAWYPGSRYDSAYCYSRWLTVPGAGVRVYVPGRAVARVRGGAVGALNMFRVGLWGDGSSAPSLVATSNINNSHANDREFNVGRWALVVDTNPGLYVDEFANSNPNIVTPISGGTAPFVSWKIIEDRAQYLPQRAVARLEGEVALRGGRYYNFRLAFRDAATHGWVDFTGGGAGTYRDYIWEASASSAAPNRIVFDAGWAADMLAIGRGIFDFYSFWPSWLCLWEASHLQVELDYGRATAYSTNSAATEFQTRV